MEVNSQTGQADLSLPSFSEEEMDTVAKEQYKEYLSSGGDAPVTAYREERVTMVRELKLTPKLKLAALADEFQLFQPAYHGTPHKFDQFSLQKIGTGEGAQAFGWGLYFAGNRKVAEYYRDRLSSEEFGFQLEALTHEENLLFMAQDRAIIIDHPEVAQEMLEEIRQWEAHNEKFKAKFTAQIKALEKLIASGNFKQSDDPIGRLFKVEIPENDEYLAWDERMDKQSPKVLEKIKEVFGSYLDYMSQHATGEEFYLYVQNLIEDYSDLVPVDIMNAALNVEGLSSQEIGELIKTDPDTIPEIASRWLSKVGVPGIRYKDQGSRTNTSFQTFNYVVFDDQLVKIMEYEQSRNMKPFKALHELKNLVGRLRDPNFDKEFLDTMSFEDQQEAMADRERGAATIESLIKIVERGDKEQARTIMMKLPMDMFDTLVEAPKFHAWLNSPDEMFQKKRGRIRFSTSGVNIDLFKDADLSTFLHETGHFYLEVLGGMAIADDAPPTVVEDYKKLLSWLGADLGDGSATALASAGSSLSRDQHELFARGFERYLMEGNAPTSELRIAFSRFRAWLLTIYRSMKSLNVELTDEVRGVFDRMVATEDEIAQANMGLGPMFEDPESLGMTAEQALAYEKAIAEAKAGAEEQLTQRLLKDVRREQLRQWNINRAKVREEVAAEVNADPIQMALSILQRGTLPDGSDLPYGMEPIKLDRKAIVAMYDGDEDILSSLPRPYIYTRKGGIHPDEAAQLLGFSSGMELLKSLPGPGEKVGEDLIDERTDQRMREEHGDMYTDGELPTGAMNAIHVPERAEVLQKELQHLASNNLATLKGLVRRIARRVPPIQQVREEATRIIAGKQVRHINPNAYRNAERKAAHNALEALLRGDIDTAFEEKEKELFNYELYRAAQAARERSDKIVEAMAKYNKKKVREVLKKAGGSYLDQIDSIMERFSFARSTSNKDLDKKQQLVDFVSDLNNVGLTMNIPPKILNEAFRTHYKEMAFQDLSELYDTVKQIEHLARLKNKLLNSARKRQFEAAKNEIISTLEANHERKEEAPDFAPGPMARLKTGLKQVAAAHTKMEFLFEWMDGNKDNSTIWQYLFKPFADAEGMETRIHHKSNEKLHDIFGAYTKTERSRWFYDKYKVPGIESSFTKANLLAVALNWGNEGNRTALMNGYGWNEAQVEKILALLDKRDWDTVQALWDHIDSFWPDIAKLESDLNGLPPEKVQATEVVTPHGTYRGGYYPIIFDSRLSWKQAILDTNQAVRDLFGGNYARAMTKHGHTKERTNSGGKPIRLELSSMTEHLSNVIHDITHRRAIVDVARLTQDKDVRIAIEQTMGKEMYKQIFPWLTNIAAGTRIHNINPIEAIMGRVSNGATVVSMGWKMTTALAQVFSYTNSIKELGFKYGLRGLVDTHGKPLKLKDTWEFVTSRSAFMADRITNYDRDVRDAMKGLNVAGVNAGPLSVLNPHAYAIQKSWYLMIGWMDMGASLPTWMGGFQKAMEGQVEGLAAGDEAAAIDYADKVVRQTQGVGAAKDMALVQTGSETYKMFTKFYSYFSVLYNQFAKTHNQFKETKNVPQLVASLALLWFLPAVLGELIVGRGPDEDDPDAEDWIKWMLKTEAAYPFATIVLLRDVVNGMDKFGYSPSAALDAFESLSKSLRASGKIFSDDDLTVTDVKGIINTVGYFAKLPTRQLTLTGQYLYEWMTGEQEPSNPAEAIYRTLITGKPK